MSCYTSDGLLSSASAQHQNCDTSVWTIGPALTFVAVCDLVQLEVQRRGLQTSAEQQGAPEWQDRYGSTPRKGADILVQCLEREGVPTVFAYPGGASMEIHQALTRSDSIRNILCRHEQVLWLSHAGLWQCAAKLQCPGGRTCYCAE